MPARTLAIGDIHGSLKALTSLLEVVDPLPDDTIIILGDYVSRGSDTKGVLDLLIDLQDRCRLITLRGNHEVMWLLARESRDELKAILNFGTREALASYGPSLDFSFVPEEHWQFIESTQPYHETETDIFVHGSAEPDVPMDAQTDRTLYWNRFPPDGPRPSGRRIICGHTVQESGIPNNIGHAVCIDTGAGQGGWLTCLDVGNNVYWQANDEGEVREGALE